MVIIPKLKRKKRPAENKSGKKSNEAAGKVKLVLKPLRIASLIIWPRFLRNSWGELKLVTWPNWKLSRQLTVAVLIFAVIFAILIGLVDWGFNAAFKALFLR